MKKHHLFSLDYIFLYICVFLIAWMGFSYYVESRMDNSYATTKRVRVGYELRNYKPETLVGAPVTGDTYTDLWNTVNITRENLLESGVPVHPYPFFVKENVEGEKFVFFVPQEDTSNIDNFLYVDLPREVAFLEFTWYPIDQYVEKNYRLIANALIDTDREYNRSELWVEVRSPWYLIPFMMHNGVFIEVL